MRTKFSTILLSATALVLVSAAAALLAAVRPGGIPLVAPPPALAAEEVDFVAVWEAFEEDDPVFVDARPVQEYEAGHITGAISVPVLEQEERLEEVRDQIPPNARVIVYCDGAECAASRKLSGYMLQKGWKDVVIFAEGFPAWQDAQMPVTEGPEP